MLQNLPSNFTKGLDRRLAARVEGTRMQMHHMNSTTETLQNSPIWLLNSFLHVISQLYRSKLYPKNTCLPVLEIFTFRRFPFRNRCVGSGISFHWWFRNTPQYAMCRYCCSLVYIHEWRKDFAISWSRDEKRTLHTIFRAGGASPVAQAIARPIFATFQDFSSSHMLVQAGNMRA